LETIQNLELPFIERRVYQLADNSEMEFALYKAEIHWMMTERIILIVASEGFPTVGMSLIYGHRVTIDAVDGGKVWIERRA
jgi:predicted aspartyl protease